MAFRFGNEILLHQNYRRKGADQNGFIGKGTGRLAKNANPGPLAGPDWQKSMIGDGKACIWGNIRKIAPQTSLPEDRGPLDFTAALVP